MTPRGSRRLPSTSRGTEEAERSGTSTSNTNVPTRAATPRGVAAVLAASRASAARAASAACAVLPSPRGPKSSRSSSKSRMAACGDKNKPTEAAVDEAYISREVDAEVLPSREAELESMLRQLIDLAYEQLLSDEQAVKVADMCPEARWLARCALEASLPPGWDVCGHHFKNQCTGEYSDTRPMLGQFGDLLRFVLHARNEAEATSTAQTWIMHMRDEALRSATRLQAIWTGPHLDPKTDVEYYFCSATGASTWSSPTASNLYLARVAEHLLEFSCLSTDRPGTDSRSSQAQSLPAALASAHSPHAHVPDAEPVQVAAEPERRIARRPRISTGRHSSAWVEAAVTPSAAGSGASTPSAATPAAIAVPATRTLAKVTSAELEQTAEAAPVAAPATERAAATAVACTIAAAAEEFDGTGAAVKLAEAAAAMAAAAAALAGAGNRRDVLLPAAAAQEPVPQAPASLAMLEAKPQIEAPPLALAGPAPAVEVPAPAAASPPPSPKATGTASSGTVERAPAAVVSLSPAPGSAPPPSVPGPRRQPLVFDLFADDSDPEAQASPPRSSWDGHEHMKRSLEEVKEEEATEPSILPVLPDPPLQQQLQQQPQQPQQPCCLEAYLDEVASPGEIAKTTLCPQETYKQEPLDEEALLVDELLARLSAEGVLEETALALEQSLLLEPVETATPAPAVATEGAAIHIEVPLKPPASAAPKAPLQTPAPAASKAPLQPRRPAGPKAPLPPAVIAALKAPLQSTVLAAPKAPPRPVDAAALAPPQPTLWEPPQPTTPTCAATYCNITDRLEEAVKVETTESRPASATPAAAVTATVPAAVPARPTAGALPAPAGLPRPVAVPARLASVPKVPATMGPAAPLRSAAPPAHVATPAGRLPEFSNKPTRVQCGATATKRQSISPAPPPPAAPPRACRAGGG